MRKEIEMDINYHDFDLNEIVDDLMDGDLITDLKIVPMNPVGFNFKNTPNETHANDNEIGE